MKIAVLSDIHIDYNRKYEVTRNLIEYLKENNCSAIIIAGDISSDYKETAKFLDKMAEESVSTYYVLGNHDYWNKELSFFDTIKYFIDHTIDNKFIKYLDLCSFKAGEFLIVGNSGWYDYSFRPFYVSIKEADKMRYAGGTWPDKRFINYGGFSNIKIADKLLDNLKSQITVAKQQSSNIISVTHIVPDSMFTTFIGDYSYDYCTSFFGNESIGEYCKNVPEIKTIIFGHTHTPFDKTIAEQRYICAPLGYYSHEWKTLDAKEEIKNRTIFLER